MKTVLYDKHVALGAKIVDFSGWEMPLQYSGVIDEHQTVRQAVGLFDVSHMGRVLITGPDAEAYLDYLSTNKVSGKRDMSATYTVWSKEDGGSVDDCIVYRLSGSEFFVVVNAGNRDKDLAHMHAVAKDFDCQITPRFDEDGILALQGAKAMELMKDLFGEAADLKFMRLGMADYAGKQLILSRTGYTGSPGYEIFAPTSILPQVWDEILAKGASYGIKPIGLGARDTLRLEMGFALYGHELSDEIAASESVSAWTVKLNKERFVGRDKLLELESSGKKRSAVGIVLEGRGVPREGCEVRLGGKFIGQVTSGGHSPMLKKGVAIALLDRPLEVGAEVSVAIRNSEVQGRVSKLPFVEV